MSLALLAGVVAVHVVSSQVVSSHECVLKRVNKWSVLQRRMHKSRADLMCCSGQPSQGGAAHKFHCSWMGPRLLWRQTTLDAGALTRGVAVVLNPLRCVRCNASPVPLTTQTVL